MNVSKKRKIDSECRVFQHKWINQYFVIENKGKVMCLVCRELISVLKEYNIKRHYESKHKVKYDSLYGQLREIEVNKLQKALTGEQTIFSKITTQNKAIISASVNVAMLIAKEGKPFTDAEFVKKCVLSMAGNICPDIVHKFEEVPLSARTITRRIEDVGDNLLNQLIKKTKTFQYFSLALDESTDIVDSAQLIVFIRGINDKFEITYYFCLARELFLIYECGPGV
ncbi:unnamed protein product [Macrosiphum euphorbiae]|uniref:SPIN-DOC-like zinc-finger domain-containing protein n=1 Tax=Macrosiphum euphorbiae TaxID=13131 RepID=A0AAV0WCI2_9HEMI|nr:unnamed protein product [Macrosiphum euphorbiae]CAI6356054.1 unnamed protein product [Macrosiphum euphorbiae]